MSRWRERMGSWFSRAERRSIDAAEYEREVDEMIDRLGQHRDKMIERIERTQPESGET